MKVSGAALCDLRHAGRALYSGKEIQSTEDIVTITYVIPKKHIAHVKDAQGKIHSIPLLYLLYCITNNKPIDLKKAI
jgi:hypothetical protein